MSNDSEGEIRETGFLVPVSASPTLQETVEYAFQEAWETTVENDAVATIHLVHPVRTNGRATATSERENAHERLSRAEERLATDIDESSEVRLERALVEIQTYPSGTVDYAQELLDYARRRDLQYVVLDPGRRIERAKSLAGTIDTQLRSAEDVTVERAPVTRPTRHTIPVSKGGLIQFVTLFGVSFAFYLVLGGLGGTFEFVTGAVSATVVAASLHTVAFERTPNPLRSLVTLGRWGLYIPFLLWKVAEANLELAYVILHPALPIDTEVVRFEPDVRGAYPITTLANSITLTPGTLTIDATEDEFVVHTLTQSARTELEERSLERALQFVFAGEGSASVNSRNGGVES